MGVQGCRMNATTAATRASAFTVPPTAAVAPPTPANHAATVPPEAPPAAAMLTASAQVPAVPPEAAPRPYPASVPPGVRLLPILPTAAPGPVTANDGGTVLGALATMAALLPTADRVAAAAAEMPGATPAQVAARVGCSERTARRYLPAPRADQRADTAPTERRKRGGVPAVAAG